jgi:hypothetical protein
MWGRANRTSRRETRVESELCEYYSSEKDLYRVECLTPERVVVEDCRTGTLIDVPVSYLGRLRPIQP